MPTTAPRLLLVALLALTLSACFTFDLGLTVSSDDTVDGSLLLAVDQALMEMGGASADVAAEEAPFDPDDERVTSFPYERDGFIGQEYRFEDFSLDEFNDAMAADASGPTFRIDRDDDRFVVSGGLPMVDEVGAAPDDVPFDPSAFFSTAELQVRMTFPGEVLETNGEVEGTTVTWDLEVGSANELSAVAVAEPGLGLADLVPWILGAVVVLALLAVVVLLVRRSDDEEPPPYAAPLDAPPGASSPTPPAPTSPTTSPTTAPTSPVPAPTPDAAPAPAVVPTPATAPEPELDAGPAPTTAPPPAAPTPSPRSARRRRRPTPSDTPSWPSATPDAPSPAAPSPPAPSPPAPSPAPPEPATPPAPPRGPSGPAPPPPPPPPAA